MLSPKPPPEPRPPSPRFEHSSGIAYAIARNWLIISGGLHSVTLTEAGRQRAKVR
jgi:hypothetical protein